MRRLTTMSALLFAALGGCDGGGTDAGGTPTTRITASTEYVDRLKSLSEMNRGLALRRAVQDSGGTCKSVDASGYPEDYKNLSLWTARCSDGYDWAGFFAPNGDVQVRDCAEAAALELPACRFETNQT